MIINVFSGIPQLKIKLNIIDLIVGIKVVGNYYLQCMKLIIVIRDFWPSANGCPPSHTVGFRLKLF
jgi:hypothetical protein